MGEKIMVRAGQFLGVLFVCCLGGVGNAHAAMDITVEGDVLVLSGSSDGMDKYALKKALTPDIHTVVIDSVKGADFEEGWNLADVIKSAKVTTVARGTCNYNCVRMFLSGQQRMFDADKVRKTVLVISGNATLYASSSVMYTDAAQTAAYLSMPRSLVEKWAFSEKWGGNNQFRPSFMLVQHPSVSLNGRSMVGCPGGTKGQEVASKCSTIEDYDALKAGIITTLDLFRMPDKQLALPSLESAPTGSGKP